MTAPTPPAAPPPAPPEQAGDLCGRPAKQAAPPLPLPLPPLPRRLGIFVGGRLQCVGQPQDLVARFGGYLSFYLTTPPGQVRSPPWAPLTKMGPGGAPFPTPCFALALEVCCLPVAPAGTDHPLCALHPPPACACRTAPAPHRPAHAAPTPASCRRPPRRPSCAACPPLPASCPPWAAARSLSCPWVKRGWTPSLPAWRPLRPGGWGVWGCGVCGVGGWGVGGGGGGAHACTVSSPECGCMRQGLRPVRLRGRVRAGSGMAVRPKQPGSSGPCCPLTARCPAGGLVRPCLPASCCLCLPPV